jgi:hydrogenase-4 component F
MESMTLILLILVPIVWAGVVALVPSDRLRPWLLPIGSAAHLALVVQALEESRATTQYLTAWDKWLVLDPVGEIFLIGVSVLHLLCMLYAPGYLNVRSERQNRVFCSCQHLSLAMMSLVILAHHLGLMWIAVEATTLVTAPGIYFNHNPRSIEATWKYLLICSVGIAIALLGSFFLAYAAHYANLDPTLLFDDLIRDASQLSIPWLHAAFVLLFVGYGTKMGLAPMHTWKPDAYGEAPGLVGTLMAGGVTSCSFLAILRFFEICNAAGEEPRKFAQGILLVMGLISMATAAIFMIRQRDFKRLLAYSSVEHMGILIFGIGIGTKTAVFGSLLHVLTNAMTKGVLFLSAGNIHRAYRSKSIGYVSGALTNMPLSASLLLAGFLAGCGSPPFGPFVSEFTIITAAFENGQYVAATLFLVFIMVIFVGMGATVLQVTFGKPTVSVDEMPFPDRLRTSIPILTFLALTLLLGIYIPPYLRELLEQARDFLLSGRAV